MRARKAPHRHRGVRLAVVLVGICLVVAACGDSDDGASDTTGAEPPEEAAPGAVEVRRTPGIDYTGTGSFRRLDVWAPTEGSDWPVAIVVPGVGQQSKATFQPLAQAIAGQGAVAYIIDVDDSVPFITAIQQTACAVHYAWATAADHGGDPDRIVLVGNSMGAPVASVVAFSPESFPGPCAVPEDAGAEVHGVVGYEGAYDYVREADYLMVDHRYLADEDPEMYAAIDPYTHVGENPDLVVRLVHGVDDDALWYDVPPGESVAFADTLTGAGYDADVRLVEGASAVDLWDADTEAFDVVVDVVMEAAGA